MIVSFFFCRIVRSTTLLTRLVSQIPKCFLCTFARLMLCVINKSWKISVLTFRLPFWLALLNLLYSLSSTLHQTGAFDLRSASTPCNCDVVLFYQRVLTVGSSDSQAYGVSPVSKVGMCRITLGTVYRTIIIKVPIPGNYVTH